MTIGFVGAGRVATALALALHERGYTVGALASRTEASARRLAALLAGRPRVCEKAQDVANGSDLVFITAPDDAIEVTAAAVRWRKGQGVVHTSGALTSSVLAGVRQAGALAASFHPMQTFAGPGVALQGTTVAIEGDQALVERLVRMATDLGCRPVVLGPEDKTLYHAGGVLASNYVVALAHGAAGLWERLGLPRDRALGALLPLLRGTVESIERLGTEGALTGPIARGDAGTIERHLAALALRAPELERAYRELGLLTVSVAKAKGTISDQMAERLTRLLATPTGAAQEGQPESIRKEVYA